VIPLGNIIHEIFSDNIRDFVNAFKPHHHVLKILNHIVSCRTPSLGAVAYECACGKHFFAYHSCRDRHCPICQGINNARWADKQMASSLPVKYFHVVFTLPDALNDFILRFPKESYNALFEAASQSLLKLCADKKHLGAVPGFTAVLHTWGQTMQFHPHLHVIITAGGLKGKALFIDKSDLNFLLPVKALSKLYRGIFIDMLAKTAPLPDDTRRSLYNTNFFCHLKESLESSGNIVKYLARYANRVCISASRLISYDKTTNTVTFSYKDNRNGGKPGEMTLPVFEFMRRFLLHVLPKRFMKIRHYGILQNRGKFDRLKICHRLLNSVKSVPIPKAYNALKCPKCRKPLVLTGHWSALRLKLPHGAVLLC
jgi:hypothetical protein